MVFSPQTKRSVHLTFVDHNDNDGNVYDVEDEFEAEVANSHDKFTFSKQNVIVIFDAAVSSPLLLSTYTETCIEKVHLSLALSLSLSLTHSLFLSLCMLERVKAFLSFSEFFSVVVAVVVFDAVVVVVAEVVEFSIISFQKRKTLNCFRQINSRPKKRRKV